MTSSPSPASKAPLIGPPDLAGRLVGGTLTGFLVLYGEVQFLLVHVPKGAVELQAALSAGSATPSTEGEAPGVPMDYHTEVNSVAHMSRRGLHPGANLDETAPDAELAEMLADKFHFVVPLKKRPSAQAPYSERISVGRARNKDIVLRHASVSKFHGWFEAKPDSLDYTDAGSRNGTMLNGKRIGRREPVSLTHGDLLTFGKVVGSICSPAILWKTINQR